MSPSTGRPRRRCGCFLLLPLFATLLFSLSVVGAKMSRIEKCNPKQFTKKAHPAVNTSYLYCNADGSLAKRDCPSGKRFNAELLDCERAPRPDLPPDGPLHSPGISSGKTRTATATTSSPAPADPEPDRVIQQPQFQAPDDICTGGTPLTKLGAPVVCNPSISSCPDGYLCTLHARTGTSYCCQQVADLLQEATLCENAQVTYFEPFTGLPKTCAMSAPSGCPTGFGCNLVGGSFTRCCGRDFGCPANSAGYVHPITGSHVQCNSADTLSCPKGFLCTQSSMFNTAICCSDTSNVPIDICGGESPLGQPNPCSASDPCPTGFGCRNGRCCPAKGVCPAGSPLGTVTQCSDERGNPCPNNFQCTTNNGHQYCCPTAEHVCGLPRDPGNPCQARGVPALVRYFFDGSTGTCRSFQFSQCGGNANNFDTLEQCEGFCLEAQCPGGGHGLRAGPALASCTPGSDAGASSVHDACPAHYACVRPRFGANFVCCSNPEEVCREPPSAGTPCFGPLLTLQRFQYNADRGQCEPFQYYGCGGTGNNFLSKGQCQGTCQPSIRSVCNGVAPLNDEGDYVQRCSENVQCPQGSWCNTRGYCCPHQETACTSPRSIGHTCLSQKPGTYWYYDTLEARCVPFTYSGCGGTPNRFAEREACEAMCARGAGGECPRGMTPLLTPEGIKRCPPASSASARACPEGSACVQSLLGDHWLCCASTAQCPGPGRRAYVIPGSDSQVACLPDDDNCPPGHQCLQSANVPGYYMCCSERKEDGQSIGPELKIARLGPFTSVMVSAVSAAKRRAMSHLLASLSPAGPPLVQYAAAAPKCPHGLVSNGERCVVNQIQACPIGYHCIGDGDSRGMCCKVQPKCGKKSRKPVFIAPRQVLTCGDEEAGCPEGASCSRSSVPGVQICCAPRDGPAIGFVSTHSAASALPLKPPRSHPSASPSPSSSASASARVSRVVPKCTKDGALPFFALGSRVPQQCSNSGAEDECPEEYECEPGTDGNSYCCPAWDSCPVGASPFLVEGSRKPLGCNWMANNCPDGYTCEGSKDRAICCRMRVQQLQCPAGRTPYLYGKRPLACPYGSKRSCPSGFECVTSRNGGNQHLCCSTVDDPRAPECVSGYPFRDPSTGNSQICDPALETCPIGFRCKRSTLANTHVCCSMPLDNRYDGYCPLGQIPYTGDGAVAAADDFPVPPTCHTALSPCPARGPYRCVYSPDKQASYCCAPVEMRQGGDAFRQPFAAAAFPPRGVSWTAQQQTQQMYAQTQQTQQQQQSASGCGDAGTVAMVSGYAPSGTQQQQATMVSGYAPSGTQQQQATMVSGYAPSETQQAQQQAYAGLAQQYATALQQQQYASRSATGNATPDESALANNNIYAASATSSNPYAMYGYGTASPATTLTTNASSASASASQLFVTSCPPWSKPLLDSSTGLGRPCSAYVRCPRGFTCYSNFPDGRNAHCCTTVPLDNQVVFRANSAMAAALADGTATKQQQSSADSSSASASPYLNLQFSPPKSENGTSNVTATIPSSASPMVVNLMVGANGGGSWVRCPPNMVNIGGMCKRMFFLGQPGCEQDSQCSARTNGTQCVRGYCACPSPLLIHESRCVMQCPEGFLNIAGRCHDLTSIMFMDSVEQRDNGTIGGFCLATLVVAEQCMVPNSYCSERTMTCQCKPGFELRIDDISNRTDKGICMEVEGSRFQGEAANRLLRDHAMDEADYEVADADPVASAFYAIEASMDPENGENVNGENVTIPDAETGRTTTKKTTEAESGRTTKTEAENGKMTTEAEEEGTTTTAETVDGLGQQPIVDEHKDSNHSSREKGEQQEQDG